LKRRTFIATTTAGIILPTILPSGLLHAKTSERKAKHVVFCLFAGGIRNFESLQKKEGNLMPYLLSGSESIDASIREGIELVPQPKTGVLPLEKQGTLFRGFRYKSDETIHYSGHAVAITGNYRGNFQIMKPLAVPTVFELFRKHQQDNTSALNTWWITDQAGPFPFLNYSSHPQYGPAYGANMLHPMSLYNIDLNRYNFFSNQTLQEIKAIREALGQRYSTAGIPNVTGGIINTEEDRFKLEQFLHKISQDIFSKKDFDFWSLGSIANEDIITMYTAGEVLKTFQPELLVVNMQHTDIGHSNFTQMCNNLQKADYALAQLWQTIQSIPAMKDNTVLIAAPEFGRNLHSSTVRDKFGRLSVDHTGDENSQKIFSLVLGPKGLVNRNLAIHEEIGESIDIVPTIAELLGFKSKVPKQFLQGRFLHEAFSFS
jgi:hypothetical protein